MGCSNTPCTLEASATHWFDTPTRFRFQLEVSTVPKFVNDGFAPIDVGDAEDGRSAIDQQLVARARRDLELLPCDVGAFSSLDFERGWLQVASGKNGEVGTLWRLGESAAGMDAREVNFDDFHSSLADIVA